MKKADLRQLAAFLLATALIVGIATFPAHSVFGSLGSLGMFSSEKKTEQKTSWPPANTKGGSETRALMRANLIFSTSPAFVNQSTRLLRNNTSAICGHAPGGWTCKLRAPGGATTTLDVDATGKVSRPERGGSGGKVLAE